MSEKVARGSLAGSIVANKMAKGDSQPLIPMSLFAAWDVDRTPPNCVPRLCSLTLSRLTVLKPLGSDVSSITLAVKMQSSKRTLRSNEIALSPGGLLDTALELRFALQYPHYLKQWEAGNRLQIMLQRRKRYKNRTILGYKTLCSGTINMAAAVQRQMDMDLELYGDAASGPAKENVAPLARVQVHSLSSQPVDHEETADRLKTLADGAAVCVVAPGGVGAMSPSALPVECRRINNNNNSASHQQQQQQQQRQQRAAAAAANNNASTVSAMSDDPCVVERAGALLAGVGRPGFLRYEDEDDDDFSTDGSDSDQPRVNSAGAGAGGVSSVAGGGNGVTDRRPARITKALLQNRGKMPNARQRNLKQKFVALLKKFKITEDLDNEAGEGCIDPSKLTGADLEMDPGDIEDLIDELEDLSDSGPEMDTLSVTSTPKPALRPFFASSRSLLAPDPGASGFGGYPSGFIDRSSFVSGTGGWLERHYSDESSKRNDSDSTHGDSLWTDREDRESDTPVASQQCPPVTPAAAAAASAQPLVQPSQEDKAKEVKRSRLFHRERSGPSLGCPPASATSSSSVASAAAPTGRDAKKSPGTPIASPTAAKASESSPRKILLEQLVRCMPADDALPDHVVMVSGADLHGCNLASRLAERQQRAVCTGGAADVRATIACLVSKIQKFCYCSAKPPPPVKVVLVGPDSYVNSVLRAYVEQLSSKPPDWKNYFKFYVVPLVSNAGNNNNNSSSNGIGVGGSNHTLARYLASLDRYYSLNFVSDSWREALDRPADKMLLPPSAGAASDPAQMLPGAPAPSKIDVQEVIHRLGRYLTSNGCTVQIPIAEAMITYCEPGSDEESTQVFIPFVSEVRIGIAESSAAAIAALGSVDTDDGQQMSAGPAAGAPAVSGSPPHQSPLLALNPPPGASSASTGAAAAAAAVAAVSDKEARDRDKVRTTPPSSPNISSLNAHRDVFGSSLAAGGSVGESVELQVDYWLSGQSAVAAAAAASTARESIASAAAASLATMVQAVKREKGPPTNEQASVKYTVKAGFRWIVVQRLPNTTGDGSSLFTMTFGLKEKKQKIMRLGKKKEKEKDAEPKSQVVEGINRLVCQAKTHHSLLKVVIDGVEWNNVKFFQLSSQWQTHIRHFPVVLFAESLL